ncbi:MAG: hypothetical protein S4CHLAM2_00260 [Chlamydiales bacterium]|nr:hypothetical protein [Chlamydiales bacterium]
MATQPQPIHPNARPNGVSATPRGGACPQRKPFHSKIPNLESLKQRARAISEKCVDLLNDEQITCLVVSLLGVAIRGLQFAGTIGGECLPYVGILTAPFSLYHTARAGKGRFTLLMCALSTGQVAESIFWVARGVDSIGKGISSCIKPFAGGVQLAGAQVSHIGMGVTFTLVLPIILIVCGAVGGIAKGWATIRTAQVLRQFNREAEKQDDSLKALGEILEYLQGPVPDVLEGSKQSALLEEKLFNENHFTNDSRRKALQERAAKLAEKSYGVDELIDLYDRILVHENLDTIHVNRHELVMLKQELMREGKEIVGTARSEIHRKLLYHALFLLVSLISITAGSLLLVPHLHTAGYALTMTSGSLFALYILFDKLVSQERFYKMERSLQRNQQSE